MGIDKHTVNKLERLYMDSDDLLSNLKKSIDSEEKKGNKNVANQLNLSLKTLENVSASLGGIFREFKGVYFKEKNK